MTPEYVPAVSALAGSMIGGVTSLTAAWLTQSRQATIERWSKTRADHKSSTKNLLKRHPGSTSMRLHIMKRGVSAFVKVCALIGGDEQKAHSV
jgi:hypothetical protein